MINFNWETLLAMFSPLIVSIIGYVTLAVQVIKKIKSFSFKKDTKTLEAKIDSMINENEKLRLDNKELKGQLSILIDKTTQIKNYEKHIGG